MKNNFLNKIKDSFESENAENAPDFIWGNLSKNLDDKTSIDSLVSQSFKNTEFESAPNHIWDNIQDQLDIDSTWVSILNVLNKEQYKGAFLKRAVVIVGILLIPFFLSDPILNEFGNANTFRSIQSAEIEGKTNLISQFKADSVITIEKVAKTKKELANKRTISSKKNIINTRAKKEEKITVHTLNNIESIKLLTVKTENIEAITINDSINKLKQIEPFEFIIPSPKEKRLSFGLITNLNNSWLIDNETRKGFKQTSLVENKFSFGYDVGAFINYNLSNNFLLQTHLYGYSLTQQNKNTYLKGKYIRKTIRFESIKLALLIGFKKELLFKKVKQENVFLLGGFSEKTTHTHEVINEKVFATDEIYKSINYGIKMNFGRRYVFNKVIPEIGINSELSLGNLNKGIYSNFNHTRKFNIGIYFKIGI